MLAILLLTTALPSQEDVVLFSDDVIEQSETCPCILPDECEEQALFSEITKESRILYNSLDCIGKNRAIELAKVECDKNCAVEQAAREMAKRQNGEYPFQKDYNQQLDERTKSTPYNRRFGY